MRTPKIFLHYGGVRLTGQTEISAARGLPKRGTLVHKPRLLETMTPVLSSSVSDPCTRHHATSQIVVGLVKLHQSRGEDLKRLGAAVRVSVYSCQCVSAEVDVTSVPELQWFRDRLRVDLDVGRV